RTRVETDRGYEPARSRRFLGGWCGPATCDLHGGSQVDRRPASAAESWRLWQVGLTHMLKKLIAANWKMHKAPGEATAFVRQFTALISRHDRNDIAILPPFISLSATLDAARGPGIAVGAQNMHWQKEGAFTGEISAPMLIAIGCRQVILGHSERRQYFGETDIDVNRKLRSALQCRLKAIVCIGESLHERESRLTERVLSRQLATILGQICSDDVDNFCLA